MSDTWIRRLVIAFVALLSIGAMVLSNYGIQQDKIDANLARDDGHQAGLIGQPAYACPYDDGFLKRNWMMGWLEGDKKRIKSERDDLVLIR